MIDPWLWWGEVVACWCEATRAWTDWCGITQPAGRGRRG